MPIYEYLCDDCGGTEERIYPVTNIRKSVKCRCGGKAKRIITASGHFTANQDAAWIRSVREVVSKDPRKKHCQEFLKNPTRQNYHNWMKQEGLRPLDKNEYSEPKPVSLAEMKEATMREYRKRNALTITR
jgi:putative FmdB family regulatory protein